MQILSSLNGTETVVLANGDQVNVDTLLGYSPSNTLTADATIDASYNGRVIVVNSASGKTLTFSLTLPVGFNCAVVQLGAGQVTFVNIVSQASFTKTAGQYAVCGIYTPEVGTNILSGDGA